MSGVNAGTIDAMSKKRNNSVGKEMKRGEQKVWAGGSWFPRNSRCIPKGQGGATRLAVEGASPWVIQSEWRWPSDEFMVYTRANMEDLIWVSRIFHKRSGAPAAGNRCKTLCGVK